MGWKQFFTPVQSLDAEQARQFVAERPADAVTLLDVRQQGEYEGSHIPGAKLVPLPELPARLAELDPEKPTLVYCAIGGRSRVAAQMLSGAGFSQVFNLSGGIKAWQGNVATGPADQGLSLFSGRESGREVLIVAYGLEKGLREFYLRMIPQASDKAVQKMFAKLADIEINHQNRLLEEYRRLTGENPDAASFDREIVAPAMEGGLSTEEYIRRFNPDPARPAEVVDLAMGIEAQALDLYQRAAAASSDPAAQRFLQQIAREEQEHLRLLGELITTL